MSRLPKVRDLTPGAAGWGYFLCTAREARPTRNGEVLLLTLQDATGQVQGRLADAVDRFRDEFDAGEFVRVEGQTAAFHGQLQLTVAHIRRVHPAQDALHGFREDECIQSSPRSIDEMWGELMTHLGAVREPHLRVLLHRIAADHATELRQWPAGVSVHHAYRGGLLEHIVKMADVGRSLARAYAANEDLVLAGVLLHDIGKLQELHAEPGNAVYTRDGNLVGHITLGVVMVREAINGIAGFPDGLRAQVEHLIVSHHGTRDHGSPIEPRTVEAFILASIDELDTRIHQLRRAVSEDGGDGEFTAWHKRLGRVFYKGT